MLLLLLLCHHRVGNRASKRDCHGVRAQFAVVLKSSVGGCYGFEG
jgi:hypothetical protein